MIEDSLVESAGRIRTRSKSFAIASFALQASVVGALILIPIVYPAALPRQALSTLLVAPPPPAAPVRTPQAPTAHAVVPVQIAGLIAPAIIPRYIADVDGGPSSPPYMGSGIEHVGTGEVPGAISVLGSAPPAPRVVSRPKPLTPVRVSAGVATGHVLVPIQPEYPAIAKITHVQGTVMIEAVISKQGLVKQARAVSGPPLLVPAALAAVNRARYVPFKLNGDPVEVDTTINIVFRLGD
jgi:protein TonB